MTQANTIHHRRPDLSTNLHTARGDLRSSAHGDLAGARQTALDNASVHGDFAAGMRSASTPTAIGDFATGMRTTPAAVIPARDDFATEQSSLAVAA